ncbi:MAG: HD domain-containing protein [Tenericutes bacterium]|nr:HD domain-containing protein [Mycoplasmatota bacterium]
MYEIFNKEINYIKNEKIRNSLVTILKLLPDYFYEIPASSTGKYHPSFSLGEGGLVRHTKVAVRIAIELFDNVSLTNFTENEKDLIIFSLIIHDGLKSGKQKQEYTEFEHPLLISNLVRENKDKLSLEDEEIDFICNCVETHMGPWTKNYKGDEVLRAPKDKSQRFVHMCDYL